jgi:hypothetical protein
VTLIIQGLSKLSLPVYPGQYPDVVLLGACIVEQIDSCTKFCCQKHSRDVRRDCASVARIFVSIRNRNFLLQDHTDGGNGETERGWMTGNISTIFKLVGVEHGRQPNLLWE